MLRQGVSISNCDTEPIRTPGCIQGHGLLLVLRASDLVILQVSENVREKLGHSAHDLLGRPLSLLLGAEVQARIAAFLRGEPTSANPLHAFVLPACEQTPLFDVTVHSIDGAVVMELEPRFGVSRADPDYYTLVKKSGARLKGAADLREFCRIAGDEVRTLTGFARVMVYKFHPDGHGEVFAESCEPGLKPWLGLRYPADDIPAPAREMFKQIWVRPVPDVGAPLSELVPLLNPDSGKPLTMTHCALRGPSVMYTEYLENMGVKATLTMAIRREGELWGLIACHHYTGARHVPFEVRAACEFFAQLVSLQHQAAEDREHAAYTQRMVAVHRALVERAAIDGELFGLTEGPTTLLDGMEVSGAALYHQGRWWRAGHTPSNHELEDLGEWLHHQPEFARPIRPVFVSDCLSRDYAPAAEFVNTASGLVAVPLFRGQRSLVMWFRPEVIRTITWGGDPLDKPVVPGPFGPRLTPRHSFARFVESVQGRALPWLGTEIEAACQLRFLVIELVVDRVEQLETDNIDLARSNEELDAFAYVASHDLKEPLRGISTLASQLLEYSAFVDPVQRAKVDSLVRLTERMDGLLDSLLHFSRVGRSSLQMEVVAMCEVLAEAEEIVDGRRADQHAEIRAERRLPEVFGNRVRLREVMVNLLTNAIKYQARAAGSVEVGYFGPEDRAGRPDAPSGVAGHTIFFVRDRGIGIDAKHFDQIFRLFKRLHPRDAYGGGTGAGLTIVKKIVERHGGRIWLTSSLGEGTTFYFTLPARKGAAA